MSSAAHRDCSHDFRHHIWRPSYLLQNRAKYGNYIFNFDCGHMHLHDLPRRHNAANLHSSAPWQAMQAHARKLLARQQDA